MCIDLSRVFYVLLNVDLRLFLKVLLSRLIANLSLLTEMVLAEIRENPV